MAFYICANRKYQIFGQHLGLEAKMEQLENLKNLRGKLSEIAFNRLNTITFVYRGTSLPVSQ